MLSESKKNLLKLYLHIGVPCQLGRTFKSFLVLLHQEQPTNKVEVYLVNSPLQWSEKLYVPFELVQLFQENNTKNTRISLGALLQLKIRFNVCDYDFYFSFSNQLYKFGWLFEK